MVDASPSLKYLSAELRAEIAAAGDMLRRTILPPPSPPKGEVLQCIDGQVYPGRSLVLAHWKGEKGGDGCTVYGSRSPEQSSEFLTLEVAARMQVRRGAVSRVEQWPWPMAGFVRRVAAEEVVLTAVPYSSYASLQFYRLGASVQSGIVPHDRVCMLAVGSPVGVATTQVIAPHGASEFRIADPSGLSTFQFATETSPGVLTGSGVNLPATYADDWVPWPANAAGLVDTVGGGNFTVEFSI